MKKVLKALLITIVLIMAIGIIGSFFYSKNEIKSDSSGKPDTTVVKNPSVKEPQWIYETQEDKINDSKIYFAHVDANELLDFKFPYDGGVTASILLRKWNNKTEAMLTITKGQFMPNTMENHRIKVKFDNEKAESYLYTDPSDGSSTIAFISNAKKFISKLKNSKVVIVECEFFEEGTRTMEFKTDGLKW